MKMSPSSSQSTSNERQEGNMTGVGVWVSVGVEVQPPTRVGFFAGGLRFTKTAGRGEGVFFGLNSDEELPFSRGGRE